MLKKLSLFLSIFSIHILIAQTDYFQLSKTYLKENKAIINLTNEDISGLIKAREYKDELLGLTHILLQQTYHGIPLYNHYINLHFDSKNTLVEISGDYIQNMKSKVKDISPSFTPENSIAIVASDLQEKNIGNIGLEKSSVNSYTYKIVEGLSKSPIQVELQYIVDEKSELKLTWAVQIARYKVFEYWQYHIDDVSGDVLD